MKRNILKINYYFRVESESNEKILSEEHWLLLKAIRHSGSLTEAAKKRNISYRQTWQKLKDAETKLGFKLVNKSRGGSNGGETLLTEQGERIIEFFDKLYFEINKDIQQTYNKMINELNNISNH